MTFPTKYSCLKKNTFCKGDFKIVPIRFEDRFDIMQWRNEQMYHLRQSEILTKELQNEYFTKSLKNVFEKKHPEQILFSFLENDKCIGYGGLVHINWFDKNAEISFIMNTILEKENFEKYWNIYLHLIEYFAFTELNLHKIHTFAFDLRPHLYKVLEFNNFKKEAVLKEHSLFSGKFIDVVIHTKINNYENI